ncbi:acyl--CoA ligase [Ignavibacteria bacterium CHB1]|nr:MAG: long-chain fatty acid--CoA ligase [Chlorobiota bacterium]MBV6398962.1 putative sulfoacetate--CoA ligase [Ignavibacteria bacterium]MCC6886200.1 acyl--CoA ligase [Ignavibacteriales bacterium]MCE7953870.1 long-chain fatty acid--CoA ligase [Chlorobi bacterium CHB7]MDL1887815.1 acyl--CoA ligase [Ignavibacteria bacterium CHB1]RIK47888.1 MAG: long-chain fatty acid--CoA ligase [Ignavibacteriota bacterium]
MDEQIKKKIILAHSFHSNSDNKFYTESDRLIKYKNIAELLNDRLSKSDFEYIKYFDDSSVTTYTYKEFLSRVNNLANFLKSNSIKFEDRIATFSVNHVDTVILYFACWISGAVVMPVNISEDKNRIRYILENSGARMVFTRDEYLDKLNGTLTQDIKVISFDSLDYSEYNETFSPDQIPDWNTESMIVYTSGTTSNPKGVVLTQYNLMVDAHYIAQWHDIKENDTMMCVLPIHHVNGTVVTVVTTMYTGGRLILNKKFSTENFLKRISEEKVKIVSVVPTLLQFMIHSNENARDYDLKHFSHIICGAGPLTCEISRDFETKFGMRIVHGYGLSESTCYSCFIPYNLSESEHYKWQNEFGFPSIGIPINCNEMEIHSDSGITLNEGTRGEIVIRGHNIMKYYYNNDEVNLETFKHGWFRSGDEGFFKFDSNGRKYFFITGRIKELIIRGGVNISPLEIDEVISGINCVKAGIAVGFENDWYGDEIGALVILKNEFLNFDKDELKRHIIKECRKKLPFVKSPKVIEFTDIIPVTSTGKYQRNKAKHLFKDYKKIQFR